MSTEEKSKIKKEKFMSTGEKSKIEENNLDSISFEELTEQLETLKRLQREDRDRFNNRFNGMHRIDFNAYSRNIAKRLIDRKKQIVLLESELSQRESQHKENDNQKQSKELTVYNEKNPILNFFMKQYRRIKQSMRQTWLEVNKPKIDKMHEELSRKEWESIERAANIPDDSKGLTQKVDHSHLQDEFIARITGNGEYSKAIQNAQIKRSNAEQKSAGKLIKSTSQKDDDREI